MSFWKTSNLEQKLAQIEGAIECGLTQAQTAVNLGTNTSNIKDFCYRYRLSYPKKNTYEIGMDKQKTLEDLKKDYFSGAKRDFWHGRS